MFLQVPVPSQPVNSKIKITFRDKSIDNVKRLKEELAVFDWNLDQFGDLNDKVNYFNSMLNKLYTKHCPLKIKYISEKRLRKPWITSDILEHIRLKSHFFKLYKSGLISKNENNHYKNRCHTIIRQAKRNYFHNYFNDYKSNMKKYWAGIKSLIGKNNKHVKKKIIESLVVDNCEITGEKELATAFNDHFSGVADNLEKELSLIHI